MFFLFFFRWWLWVEEVGSKRDSLSAFSSEVNRAQYDLSRHRKDNKWSSAEIISQRTHLLARWLVNREQTGGDPICMPHPCSDQVFGGFFVCKSAVSSPTKPSPTPRAIQDNYESLNSKAAYSKRLVFPPLCQNVFCMPTSLSLQQRGRDASALAGTAEKVLWWIWIFLHLK